MQKHNNENERRKKFWNAAYKKLRNEVRGEIIEWVMENYDSLEPFFEFIQTMNIW